MRTVEELLRRQPTCVVVGVGERVTVFQVIDHWSWPTSAIRLPLPPGLGSPSWIDTCGFSRRAVGLHALIVVIVPVFAALCVWQVRRALGGSDLSWACVFEWPFFARLRHLHVVALHPRGTPSGLSAPASDQSAGLTRWPTAMRPLSAPPTTPTWPSWRRRTSPSRGVERSARSTGGGTRRACRHH